MSGQIVNGEADISIAQASTIMMTDELHGISFLHSTSKGIIVAVFRQPPSSSIRDILTSAFQLGVWTSAFITWIVLIVSIRVIFRINNVCGNVEIEDEMFAVESSWWALSSSCYMGNFIFDPTGFILLDSINSIELLDPRLVFDPTFKVIETRFCFWMLLSLVYIRRLFNFPHLHLIHGDCTNKRLWRPKG